MQTKQCSKCGKIKSIEDFRKVKYGKYGVRGDCKDCVKIYSDEYKKNNSEKVKEIKNAWKKNNPDYIKKYRENHPEKFKELRKDYYKNNPEELLAKKKAQLLARKKAHKIWVKNNIEKVKVIRQRYYKNNPGYYNEYCKKNPEKIKELLKKGYKKKMSNPIFCLSQTISTSIRISLKNNKCGKHWETLVNFTLQDLKEHLEKQFKEGMSWENRGYYGWHIDHRKPISSFNFTTYKDTEFKQCWSLQNLQPLWAYENLSKGNRIL